MTLHLIRHGKTAANEQRLYCGFTDPPLSEAGRRELLLLKAALPYPSAPLLVHSGLTRTVETMGLLTGRENGKALPDLREMHFGDFEGKSYDMLKEDSRYIAWITDKRPAPPGGESRDAFRARVLRGYGTLQALCPKGGELLAFTHGGVIAVLMEELFPGKRNFYEWQPAFGRGYSLCLEKGKSPIFTEI